MAKAIGRSVFVLLLGCQEEKSIDAPFELLTSKVWKLTAHGTGHYSDNTMRCGAESESDFNWQFLRNDARLEIAFEQFSLIRLT